MEITFCQSCCMSLLTRDDHGTNSDGSMNDEYCCHCFKDGAFTLDCSMEQMIEHCIQYIDEFNKDSDTAYTTEEAIARMRAHFPTLKRWKK